LLRLHFQRPLVQPSAEGQGFQCGQSPNSRLGVDLNKRIGRFEYDGSDLAAALQTILEIGDRERLEAAISRALPGRSLVILCSDGVPNTQLTVGLTTEGCARALVARELSDGTLRFLCLAASLLSPRPPALIAINEPESSLHPDLLPALAELIVNAAEYSQIWISTHSAILADNIQALSGVRPIRLKLVNGETAIETEEED